MNALISVVIPIYNQEKYIGDCLKSVFAQCSDQVEVLLVNDGSTDRSAAICRECMGQYPVNAKLIEQENSGSLVSRMTGIQHAGGEYILFVDSDDLLLDNALDTLIHTVRDKRPDMILFNATCDLASKKPFFNIPLRHEEELKGEDRYRVHQLLCGTEVLNNLWTKCIKKTLFQEAGRPETGRRITNGEDLYQILALADKAQSFVYLDRVLYYYRVMDNSMSRVYNPYYFDSEKIVCSRRLEYAQKWSKVDELIGPARFQTYRIMRETTRKLIISSLPWATIRTEVLRFRSDAFYRQHYLDAHDAPDKRDLILKAPYPLLRMANMAYGLKAKLK